MNRPVERLRSTWRALQQRALLILTGTLLFGLAFGLGCYLFFPVATVQRWLTEEIGRRTGASIELDAPKLSPLLTMRTPRGRLSFPDAPQAPIDLVDLRLRPRWSTLFSGDPGIALETAFSGGMLSAVVTRGGTYRVDAEGLQFDKLPLHRETGTLLSGTLLKAHFATTYPAQKSGRNALTLEMERVSLNLLGQPLALGKIRIDGDGQQNTLQLATLTASGGDLAVSGTGTLLLGASPAASRISLDLTLRPAPAAPATITALLEVAARKEADGGYRLRLSGSPARLAIE